MALIYRVKIHHNMDKRLYIIAGTKHQFDLWCLDCARDRRYPETNFIYVSGADMLRGISDPDGLCIGTWKDRPDILDIVDRLWICTRTADKSKKVDVLRKLAYDHKMVNA